MKPRARTWGLCIGLAGLLCSCTNRDVVLGRYVPADAAAGDGQLTHDAGDALADAAGRDAGALAQPGERDAHDASIVLPRPDASLSHRDDDGGHDHAEP